MSKLRVLDLFSGIGGFSLGLERAGGFETVGFVEIKPHARAVLAKHWPNVDCHDDIETRHFHEGEADVITGGFPCQDISFAGPGAGLAGARSGLYRHLIRAIRVVRPLYAIVENVAALLSRGLGTVLGDLAEIGYDAEWHCIPASAVGAPHRRDRVWIVANAGGEQHEGYRPPLSGSLASQLSDTALADTKRVGSSRPRQSFQPVDPAPHGDREAGDAFDGRLRNQWAIEPDVGRVAHGVPNRVDRLEELGNAVVSQIPEIIGRALQSRQAAA